MDHFQRQYLVTAAGLVKANPRHTFYEDEVTNHIDLDPTESNYIERFNAITTNLLEMGLIREVPKGPGVSRRALRVTNSPYAGGRV